ncbi:MAG: hypothetical protein ACRDPO_37495 [Streptosporangiaceae bacterium]
MSTSRHQEAGSPSVAGGQYAPVVVRAGEAEYLPSIGHILLADSPGRARRRGDPQRAPG